MVAFRLHSKRTHIRVFLDPRQEARLRRSHGFQLVCAVCVCVCVCVQNTSPMPMVLCVNVSYLRRFGTFATSQNKQRQRSCTFRAMYGSETLGPAHSRAQIGQRWR